MLLRIRYVLACIALFVSFAESGVAQGQAQGQNSLQQLQLLPSAPLQGAAQSVGVPVIRSVPDPQASGPDGTRPPDERSRAPSRDSERGRDAAGDRAEQQRARLSPPLQRSEFQDFVARSAGRVLPLFGYELFRDPPSTFSPVDRVPVTPEYLIGPGDEILIRGWGQIDLDVKAVVDRNGAIYIPHVGSVNVAGVKYQDLREFLKSAIGRNFRQFDLTASLGRLRSIQIFVVGQAARPGTYTVSSLSTLVNALFASGGPSTSGSMRRIQLKRGNQVVTEFDLYDLLLKGDKSRDVQVLPGDVIYIPPVGPLAAISGSVNSPAIFELKEHANLASLIDWAGGLATTAAGQKVLVERIDNRKARKVDEFSLGPRGLARELSDGDLVTVYAVSPRIENAITLRGQVAQPARVPWFEGMRIRDLIPNRDALMSRDYWINRNALLVPNNWITLPRRGTGEPEFDMLGRPIRPQFDSSGLPAAPVSRSVTPQYDASGRLITPQFDAAGRTLDPQREIEPTDTRRELERADARREMEKRDQERLRNDIKRYSAEINWDYAVVERLKQDDLTTMLIPFNLGKAVLEGQPDQNIVLQPGDVITVFSKDDIRVPVSRRTQYVRIEGELRFPGLYQLQPGETLRQVVTRVGGLTSEAYLFGAELTRERTRVEQQKELDRLVEKMGQDFERAAALKARSATTPEDAASAKTQAESQRNLLERLRLLRATGRIVLEIPPGRNAVSDLPDIVLEDGDRFLVSSQPSTVSVFGSVYVQNAFLYRPDKRVDDYVAQAGGPTKDADQKSIYVVRADGSVLSKRQSNGLFSRFGSDRLMPNDAIVVPEDLERVSWTKVLKDWSQIFSQFALGFAALKVLSNGNY